jgi:hypothetical protein
MIIILVIIPARNNHFVLAQQAGLGDVALGKILFETFNSKGFVFKPTDPQELFGGLSLNSGLGMWVPLNENTTIYQG